MWIIWKCPATTLQFVALECDDCPQQWWHSSNYFIIPEVCSTFMKSAKRLQCTDERHLMTASHFETWGCLNIKEKWSNICFDQGPTSTRYSNRTQIFLYYSNPARNFLKIDRVASSMYSSHFRKIAARLTIFCCSWYKTFPFWQKFDQRSSWKSCHLIF